MPFAPTLTVLAYVLSPDRRQVLLVHRNARTEDAQRGKWNGLGGKVNADEDAVTALRRELAEEAGIVATAVRLRGTISWPGFGVGGEHVFCLVFVVDAYEGTPPDRNAEGDLAWVDVDRLGELPMWEGDRHFLPLLFDPAVGQFHGVMPYVDGRPTSWQVSVLD